jgi:N-glycosylase/DNA lyase
MSLSNEHRAELHAQYADMQGAIAHHLHEFGAVSQERYFYELCFCLMTPQSSAVNCNAVACELERLDFYHQPFDPEPLLRNFKQAYIRFHKTKAKRIMALRWSYQEIASLLEADMPSKAVRELLVSSINGIGYKEASHFLRNIGRRDLAIIDRHIIRNLLRFGYLIEWPKAISKKRYDELEQKFFDLAGDAGIPPCELDLLLWYHETGFILK